VARVRKENGIVAIGLHDWIVGKNERFAAELDRFIGECSADRSIRLCGIGDALPDGRGSVLTPSRVRS
jgi:hypothetical protein